MLQKTFLLVCVAVLSKGYPLTQDVTDSYTPDQYADSCWRELEQLVTEAVEIMRDESAFSSNIPPMFTSAESRRQFVCEIADMNTAEDLTAFIDADKEQLEMYANIARQVIQVLGGKEGIKKLGEAYIEYFQFWMDADIGVLPKGDCEKEKLRKQFAKGAPILSDAVEKLHQIFPTLELYLPVAFVSEDVLNAVLESSSITEISERTEIHEAILKDISDTSLLSKWKKLYQVVIGIINELLDKNWLGLAEAGGPLTSCWPEVKGILSDMIKLSEAGDLLLEEFIANDRPILSNLNDEQSLETFVCQLKGVKSVSDLAAFFPQVPGETFKEEYMRFKEVWDAIGGMDGIHTIATVFDHLLQLAIDIDFPHQFPVTSISRQGLLDRMKEIKTVMALYMEAFGGEGAFNAEVEAAVDATLESIADALIDSPDLEAFANTLHIPPFAIQKFREVGEQLPALQNFLHLGVALLEQFDSHGLMDLEAK